MLGSESAIYDCIVTTSRCELVVMTGEELGLVSTDAGNVAVRHGGRQRTERVENVTHSATQDEPASSHTVRSAQ